MEPKQWSQNELRASVIAYLDMLSLETQGKKFVKAVIIRELQTSSLSKRTRGSIEKRFQNISSVLENIGRPWVKGYKPLSHVGVNVWKEILYIINECEAIDTENR